MQSVQKTFCLQAAALGRPGSGQQDYPACAGRFVFTRKLHFLGREITLSAADCVPRVPRHRPASARTRSEKSYINPQQKKGHGWQ